MPASMRRRLLICLIITYTLMLCAALSIQSWATTRPGALLIYHQTGGYIPRGYIADASYGTVAAIAPHTRMQFTGSPFIIDHLADDRTRGSEIWRTDIRTDTTTRLTNDTIQQHSFSTAPTGDFILYSDVYRLFLLSVEQDTITRLPNLSQPHLTHRWSADGHWLVYSRAIDRLTLVDVTQPEQSITLYDNLGRLRPLWLDSDTLIYEQIIADGTLTLFEYDRTTDKSTAIASGYTNADHIAITGTLPDGGWRYRLVGTWNDDQTRYTIEIQDRLADHTSTVYNLLGYEDMLQSDTLYITTIEQVGRVLRVVELDLPTGNTRTLANLITRPDPPGTIWLHDIWLPD